MRLVSIALVLGLFYLILNVAKGEKRHLLQNEFTYWNVSNASELQQALQEVQANDVLLISSERIQLADTILLNTPGITLRSIGNSHTVFECPNRETSAINISASSIKLENLELTGCVFASAVVIEGSVGSYEDLSNTSVVLNQVHFVNNGESGQLFGAGVHIKSCTNCINPEVQITSCHFMNNKGRAGSAVYCENCSLEISTSIFINNEASFGGGAIYLQDTKSTVTISDSTFVNNSAIGPPPPDQSENSAAEFENQVGRVQGTGSGGAIQASESSSLSIRSCSFHNNRACQGGGALAILASGLTVGTRPFNFIINNSSFTENTAYCGEEREPLFMDEFSSSLFSGGALLYETEGSLDLNWTINASTFQNNSATTGGAIAIYSSPEQDHNISQCNIIGNEAHVWGGGVFIRGSKLTLQGVIFQSNVAEHGGGLAVSYGANVVSTLLEENANFSTLFLHNEAIYGGGLYLNRGNKLDLTKVVLRGNVAFRQGGGFMCFLPNDAIWFRGAIFEENQAVVGGAIAYANAGNLTLLDYNGFPTKFIRNLASVGGGIYYEEGHIIFVWIHMNNVQFIGNRAVNLTRELTHRPGDSEPAVPLQGVPGRSSFASRLDNRTDPEAILNYLTEIPQGHGGGVCLKVLKIRLFTYAEVFLKDVRFEENEAVIGGGMNIHMNDHYWNLGTEVYCFRIAFAVYTCQRFIFENVIITGNKAIYAGGLFTTNAEKILLTCNRHEGARNSTLQAMILNQNEASRNGKPKAEDYCTRIENNSISDGMEIEGANVGSSALDLVLLNDKEQVNELTSGAQLEVPCGSNEGDQCHNNTISIAVKDAFNQTIVRGIPDAELEVIVDPDHLLGDLRYTAHNGIIQVDNLRVWGINVNLTLSIKKRGDDQIHMQASFMTRSCHPGEFTDDNVCRECPPDRYNFNGQLNSCRKCEDDAICSGGAVLVPIEGYWHSTPFSPQFHRCFLHKACDFANRSNGEQPEFDDYNQCAKGYTGILCGSCEEDYGRSFSGECKECPDDKRVAGVLAGIALFWTFILIGINCIITLASTRARVHLVLFELKQQSTIKRRPVLERAVHIGPDIDPEASSKRPISMSHEYSDLSESECHILMSHQLVATVQLTETLKILVNYLQVTSAALRLQIEWSASLNGLLSVFSALVGFGSESLDLPFECNFNNEEKTPRSIIALWLRIFTPSMVLCTLIIIFTGLWYLSRFYGWKPLQITKKTDRGSIKQSWLTSVIIITIVTVYFSYIDITREFLRTVNCIQVDEDTNQSSENPYEKYAVETGYRIWAEDTTMVCFKGDHRGTGIAGIFGLVFALITVVFIIVWLPLNHHNRKDPHFIARYWFIYQAYKRDWFASWWEAAILIRKALIATVVVFSVHLGPNLQAVLCVGILIIAYGLQIVFRPFKLEEEHEYVPDYFGVFFKWIHVPKLSQKWIHWNNSVSLNGLESASLVCSIVVFFIGVIINDSSSSIVITSLLTGVGVLLNGMYLCYMFFRLYSGIHIMLDWRLELADSGYMATHPNGSGLINLFKKAYRLAHAHWKQSYGDSSNDAV
eukprot:g2830.t1